MNVIIVSQHGIIITPILVEDDTTAQAEFDSLAESLAGDDINLIQLHSDSQVDQLNSVIAYRGIRVDWFVDVEVNNYINGEE